MTLIGSGLQIYFFFPFVFIFVITFAIAGHAIENLVGAGDVVGSIGLYSGFVVPMLMNVIAIYHALAIRRELNRLNNSQPQTLSLQEEEGSCNSINMDFAPASLEELQQQPQVEQGLQAVLPPPTFYPVLHQNMVAFVPVQQ